jgi:hypothetical protein
MGTIYRIYTVESDGHYGGPPVQIECSDDADAVDRAKRMKNGKALEVWHDARRVAEIK